MIALSSHLKSAVVGALALTLAGCAPAPDSQSAAPKPSGDKAPAADAAKPASSGEAVVIGVAGPFTGSSSEFGVQIRMGAEQAAKEINEAGGINGRTLELRFEDDAGNPADAQSVATRLASDDKVVAILGHFNSSCSLAGKAAYGEAGLVMFSPASTNVNVTKDSDLVYRNIFTDDFQGKSLANYAGNAVGAKKVAILFDNDDYGTGLKESFKGRAAELGIQIVSEVAYGRDSNDFRSQLETIRAAAPDAILIAGLYNNAALIAKQARELGIQTQLLGGDGVFSPGYIQLGGAAAEGTFITSPFLFDLGGEAATKFAEAFRKSHNRDPDAWAALSYDGINIMVEGMKKHGVDRKAILTHLKSINSPETAYTGLTGKTFFDAEGDCLKPVQVAVVKGGKFVAADRQLNPDGTATAPRSAQPAAAPAASAAATTTP